jgi:DNA-binding SARP family transcriptional activator
VSSNLHIKLLGEFRLMSDGQSITGVNSERLQALLALIVLHQDTPQLRQQLAVHLWPEAIDTDAKANLRRRLHELKQLIPEIDRWLRVEPKTIQWIQDESCRLDVAEFKAAIAASNLLPKTPESLSSSIQALEQAANLYHGDLLPSCYDDWIEPYREQLRQQAIAGLDQLVTADL